MPDDSRGPEFSNRQFHSTFSRKTAGAELSPMPLRKARPENTAGSAEEPSDHALLEKSREGDQDAATELYFRYAERLNRLVERQCSTELARREGVQDIVQSVFGSFFRGLVQGFYDVPDGDELWRLLLIIALHKIRSKAAYHHAAKRDAHRTINGSAAGSSLESQANSNDTHAAHLELVLIEILERLPARSRTIVELRINGCDVAEVARYTGRSKRSVERILQETRLTLGQLLAQED
jgi:RNA polymerase sigma-70 factor (ECF subfamily)